MKTLSETEAGISNKKPRRPPGAAGLVYGRFVKVPRGRGGSSRKPPSHAELQPLLGQTMHNKAAQRMACPALESSCF